jgi:aspartyl-tRNA(Asn)/glutamyl-tRNA(Gln) amidotransferase subunit A
MEMKPVMQEVTAGHEDKMFTYSKTMLATPDTPVKDYVSAEEGIERIQDGFAEYFEQYDVLLLPVTSIFAHAHGLTEYTIDGQKVDAFRLMTPTVPFNLTGLPALAMRFGTSSDGMPIAVQLAANSYAESTILYIASLLESLSPVRDQHPAL